DTFEDSVYAVSRKSKIVLGLLCVSELLSLVMTIVIREKRSVLVLFIIAGLSDTCLTIAITVLFNYKLFVLMVTQVQNISTSLPTLHATQYSSHGHNNHNSVDISTAINNNNNNNNNNGDGQQKVKSSRPFPSDRTLLPQIAEIMSNWNEQQTNVALTLIQPITKFISHMHVVFP
ncbi:hypothetical protein RFI_19627, partial [Reticulomyxa filosa]